MLNWVDAKKLALEKHKDQKCLGGKPYIFHLERVACGVGFDDKLRSVAYLHDIIEDTDTKLDDLVKLGFNPEVVEAVGLLTKNKNQEYEDYIFEISKNELATKVKISDLRDNMDLMRLEKITEKDKERVVKYMGSYLKLVVLQKLRKCE